MINDCNSRLSLLFEEPIPLMDIIIHIRRISKYLLAFSAENKGQKELFSLMLYGLFIEFVHCLFKDLVKRKDFQAFETYFT